MRKPLLSRLSSTRARAVLGLGAVLGLSVTGTFAFWTDSVTIAGQTLTSGNIDLQAGATAATTGNTFTTTTLGTTAMVPGDSVAQVLVLKNAGNVPLKWTAKGGLLATGDAAAFDAQQALRLTITDGAPTGSAPNVTCSAGSITYVNDVAMKNVSGTDIIATRQAAIAGGGGTKTLCISIKLAAGADQALSNGKTATSAFTFLGTSDVS